MDEGTSENQTFNTVNTFIDYQKEACFSLRIRLKNQQENKKIN
jgi:hypothetical protein